MNFKGYVYINDRVNIGSIFKNVDLVNYVSLFGFSERNVLKMKL